MKPHTLFSIALALPLTVAGLAASSDPAQAQSARLETLVVANEFGPNMLDIHGLGANRPAYGVSWLAYDRLLTYGRKTLPDGVVSYDFTKLEPELAERWEVAEDGMSVTFHLRRDATFHDGSPVTAADVKWSFERALGMGGFPTFQMKAGSLEQPEQFEVVDEHTFRLKLLRRDKMTLPDLAVPVAAIYNSTLAKQHATADDPWAASWLKTNTAGGGAYRVASWKPGQEIVYERFDDWKNGPLPKLKRVIQRDVPSAGNRRALLTRGDIDITYELPPKDFAEMAREKGNVKVVSVPIENSMWYLGLNTKTPPFDNVKVRQAIAYVLPYDKIMENAFYKRGASLFGGDGVTDASWPQPTPYVTNVEKARELMKEAGLEQGFETTLSFDLGTATVSEPTAILIQESLASIGIKATINKVPGSNWRAAITQKDMPMLFNRMGGWLNYPEYFFFWAYHGQNAVFNTMSYQNPELDQLVESARFETDPQQYAEQVRQFIDLAYAEVPRIPVVQPTMDVAMRDNVQGFTYWFHLQPDYRQLYKQ